MTIRPRMMVFTKDVKAASIMTVRPAAELAVVVALAEADVLEAALEAGVDEATTEEEPLTEVEDPTEEATEETVAVVVPLARVVLETTVVVPVAVGGMTSREVE